MATNSMAASGQAQSSVDEAPGCAYGLVTRRGLDDLTKDFERLEAKINGILIGVAVTALLEVWKTIG